MSDCRDMPSVDVVHYTCRDVDEETASADKQFLIAWYVTVA